MNLLPPGTPTALNALARDGSNAGTTEEKATLRSAIGAERGAVVNVRDYGATGDGTTNDSTAISSAIAALTSAGGGVLFFPRGDYFIGSAEFTLSVPATVLGQGALCPFDNSSTDPVSVTRIKTGAVGTKVFTVSAHGCHFEKLTIYNTADGTSNSSAIYFTAGDYSVVSDCAFVGFYNQVHFEQGRYYTVTTNKFFDPINYGLLLRNTASGQADYGDQLVTNNIFCAQFKDSIDFPSAVRWESGGGLRFIANKVNGNQRIFVDSAQHALHIAVSNNVSTSVFIIDGNSLEGLSSDAILVDRGLSGTNGVVSKIVVTSNEFTLNGGGYALKINPTSAGFSDVNFTGNVVTIGPGVSAKYVAGIMVGPNSYSSCVAPMVSFGAGCTDTFAAPQIFQSTSRFVIHEESTYLNATLTRYGGKAMDFTRGVPATTSTSTYTKIYELEMHDYSGIVLELTLSGNCAGLGGFVKTYRIACTKQLGAVTAAITSDVEAGVGAPGIEIRADTTAVSGRVDLGVRLAASGGSTAFIGLAQLRVIGPFYRIYQS